MRETSLGWRDVVVESAGTMLAVRDYGGNGDPPLLLLHGSGDTLAAWEEVSPLLARSFRVVAYDAPGHGHSDAPREAPRLSHFFDAVDDVAAALRLRRPILVGHSMGGVVVLLYAAERRGARCVISIDGAYVREASDPPRAPAGEEQIRSAGVGWTGSKHQLERLSQARPAGPARASFRRAHHLRPDGNFERRPPAEFVHAMSQFAASLESRLTGDDLYASIGCAVLLVCGEHGSVQGEPMTAELRRRVNALPARFRHVELAWLDSGHMVHWEWPRELAILIKTFAQRY